MDDYLDMKDLKDVESHYLVKRAGTDNFRFRALRLGNQTDGSHDFLTNESYSYENNTKLEIYSQNIDRDQIQKLITLKIFLDADFADNLTHFDIMVYGKDFEFKKFKK